MRYFRIDADNTAWDKREFSVEDQASQDEIDDEALDTVLECVEYTVIELDAPDGDPIGQ